MADETLQPDEFDDRFIESIVRTIRESEPAAAPHAVHPGENKATVARSLAHPDAPQCTVAHPTPSVQLAKQSHGVAAVQVGAAARPGVMTPRKIGAVRLLLAGYGVVEVAAAVGVGRHTITRWTKDPAFQAEARRQIAAVVPLTKK